MAPGNDQSGGKRKNAPTRKRSKFLRRALVEAAHAAAHKKSSYLTARYRHLVVRRGPAKAAVALGHAILVSAYHMLAREEDYHEIDPRQYDERRRARLEKRAVEQLRALGYDVTLTQTKPAA